MKLKCLVGSSGSSYLSSDVPIFCSPVHINASAAGRRKKRHASPYFRNHALKTVLSTMTIFCGICQCENRSTEVQLRAKAKKLCLWGTLSYYRYILDFPSAVLAIMMTNLTTNAQDVVSIGPQSSSSLVALPCMLCLSAVNKKIQKLLWTKKYRYLEKT